MDGTWILWVSVINNITPKDEQRAGPAQACLARVPSGRASIGHWARSVRPLSVLGWPDEQVPFSMTGRHEAHQRPAHRPQPNFQKKSGLLPKVTTEGQPNLAFFLADLYSLAGCSQRAVTGSFPYFWAVSCRPAGRLVSLSTICYMLQASLYTEGQRVVSCLGRAKLPCSVSGRWHAGCMLIFSHTT